MSTPATAESRSSTISAASLLPGSGWVAGKPANAAGEAVWRSRREDRRLRSGGPHGDPFLFQPWRRRAVMFGADEQIFDIPPTPVPLQACRTVHAGRPWDYEQQGLPPAQAPPVHFLPT